MDTRSRKIRERNYICTE